MRRERCLHYQFLVSSFLIGNGCTLFLEMEQMNPREWILGEKAAEVTDYLMDLAARNPNFVIDADGLGP